MNMNELELKASTAGEALKPPRRGEEAYA